MLGGGLIFGDAAAEEFVGVGAGSYTTERPATVEPLPDKIYKTDALKGATPTNQWWSSLMWDEFSQNMYPHPLAMVCHKGGLALSYPGAAMNSGSGNIMGGGVSKNGDINIGHSAKKAFSGADYAGNSQWFVTAEFEAGDARLRTHFGHGSPFVFCELDGGTPELRFAITPEIWAGGKNDASLGVTVRGNHYGIFGSGGSYWKGQGSKKFTNEDSGGYFTVALLPNKDEETFKLFASVAHNHVIGTRAVASNGKGMINTTYEFALKTMEGSGEGTIFALYPHQWKYTDTELTEMSYRSVRGEMKIAKGSSFETSVPVQGLLPVLPREGIPDRERMIGYLKEESGKAVLEFADTYWEGKHLGKLATLAGIADVIDAEDLRDHFLNEIKRRLENWFVASPGEESPLFYYDENWGTLIGSKPSYGSDSQINDHHFHYGYFIRAAAEVVRFDPAWAEKWGPMVELLIRDIASSDQEDPLFPHIRCFDIYAGHSWASGHANFADGNNQESSSESMNAWYGLMLWGEVTGNKQIQDTGLYLFNTERTAVEEYWFDVSGTNFPEDFSNVALGMVWGGKGAFATWFSPKIDHIHGINWLPFTPASIYMGRFPDYVEKNYSRIVEQRESGDDFSTDWGDLVVMFGALSEPERAARYIDKNPECSLEGGNTHAFMYHWIHTLDALGRNDRSVVADYPFVNIYKKDGIKTYAAYNFGESAREVRFSDGTTLLAAPKSMTLKPSKP